MLSPQFISLANEFAADQTGDHLSLIDDVHALESISADLIDALLNEAIITYPINPHLGRGYAAIAWNIAHDDCFSPALQARSALIYGQTLVRTEFPGLALTVLNSALKQWEAQKDPVQVNLCNWQISVAYRLQSRFKEAVELLTKTAEEMEGNGYLVDAACCWRELAITLNLQGRAEISGVPLNKSLEIFNAFDKEIEIAKCRVTNAARLQWLGHFDDALDELSKALPIFEKEHLLVEQGSAYYTSAFLNMQRGTLENSIEYLNKARNIFSQVGLSYQIARCDNVLGSAFLRDIRPQEAIPCLERAALWFQEHNLPVSAAHSQANLGLAYELLGDYPLARKFSESVIPVFQSVNEVQSTANSQFHLGVILCKSNYLEESLGYLEKSWQTWQDLNRPLYAANCALYLSYTCRLLGQEENRFDWLTKALLGFEKTNSPVGIARTQIELSNYYFTAGRYDCALETANKAREMLSGNTADMAYCERRLGEVSAALDDIKTAIEHFSRSIEAFSEIGMQVCVLESQIALGEVQGKVDEPQAHVILEKSMAKAAEWHLPELAWRASTALAEQATDTEKELEYIKKANYWLSLSRRRLTQTTLEKDYLNGKTRVLDRGINLSLQLGQTETALLFNDETRSQTLAAQYVSQMQHQEEQYTGVLSQKRRRLLEQINNLERELRTNGSSQRSSLISYNQSDLLKRHHLLAEEYETISAQIERASRNHGHLSDDLIPVNTKIFKEMNWNCVSYHLSGNLLTTLIATPEGITSRQHLMSQIEQTALDMCASTNSQKRGLVYGQPDAALINYTLSHQWRRLLYDLLIPPDISNISDPNSTLIIAPHGLLYNLPFHALIDERGTHLIEKTAISYAPSLSLLQTCAGSVLHKEIQNAALIIGIQSFNNRHQELPYAREEACLVNNSLSIPSKLLLDEQVTISKLQELSGHYRIIHIATHGFTNQAHGRLAGIALSDQDLLLDDLSNIGISAPIVVLSACETGVGLGQIDNQIGGVAGVFFALGATVAIATLWPAFDPITAKIMQDFYQGIESGYSVALALANAQRKYLDSPLYYWAPLACFGLPDQSI